jgi:formylglycine-generating enzyme required for sulfatase activity
MEYINRNAVTGITWYAAQAFCEWLTTWLTTQLPLSMANMEIRLPTENEWQFASSFISNMRNPGWEWCADHYVPLPFITAAPEAIETVGSLERSLRGRHSPASTETRASLPPDLSSPIVTFRTVIVEKE